MTALPNNDRTVRLAPSAGATALAYDFWIARAEDLAVWRVRAGTATLLTLTTDYAVAGAGSDAGGTVTLAAAAQAGDAYVLAGAWAIQQVLDLVTAGEFRADDVDHQHRLILAALMELRRDLARTLTAPAHATSTEPLEAAVRPINGLTYLELNEATVAAPANDKVRLYAKDVGGVTKVFARTSTQDVDLSEAAASASAAAASAAAAAASSGAASTARDEAEAAAASLSLPALAGQAGKFLKVKGDESGYEHGLSAAPVASVNGETGAVVLDARDVAIGALVPAGYVPGASSIEAHLGAIDAALLVGRALVEPVNLSLACSVAGNALTIAIKTASGADPSPSSPVLIPFRSVTPATGTPAVVAITAATSLVVSSGSTIGAANGVPFRGWIVALNDGGTARLGVVNCVTANGVVPLFEGALQSSTAEGGAGGADAAGVIYTGTAAASKALRRLGYFEYQSGLTTAGTWDAAPTVVHLANSTTPGPGDIVQTRVFKTATVASGTTTTPNDDTIPQNTEGTQFVSLDITPTSAINRLLHVAPMNPSFSVASGAWIIAALFQDAVANALASATTFAHSTAAGGVALDLLHEMAAGTTAATTFKIRIGANAAGTVHLLGSAARFMGGTKFLLYTITEIMA